MGEGLAVSARPRLIGRQVAEIAAQKLYAPHPLEPAVSCIHLDAGKGRMASDQLRRRGRSSGKLRRRSFGTKPRVSGAGRAWNTKTTWREG